MDTILDRLPRGAPVAAIRLRSLGDCVLTTPALRILKQARPDLRVAVVVEDRFQAVFEGNQDVDRLLPPGAAALRSWRPHLCLNLHGGTRSALLTVLSGARFRAAFEHFRWAAVYNVRIPRAQEILDTHRVVHTAEHLASAVFYLGAGSADIPAATLYSEPGKIEHALPYAVIHPIASEAGKTWPADRFVEVAKHLRSECGFEPIFIAGPGEDLTAFKDFRNLAGAPLAEVKSLLRSASVFIGNDSGPAHMAAAFQIPVVVMFGNSDPRIWGPWKVVSETIVGSEGIASISTDQVLQALNRLRVHA